MRKDTRNNSPDSKPDDWHGFNVVHEIVKFFEAKADTEKPSPDKTTKKASATLVGAETQLTDKTTKPSVLVTRTAPDSPLVDIKTIEGDNPSMPAASSPGSTRSRSPDSAAGVFGGKEPSSPCRTPHEISTTPTFIEAIGANFSDVFSAFGDLFQVNPATPTKPPIVNNRGRTGSAAPSSSRRSKSPTSEITEAAPSAPPTPAAAPSAPPTPAAAPSDVSTQNKEVKNKTRCLPKLNFLAELLSKFSHRDSQDTDKKSVVSATPSRAASTIAESARARAGSERGSTSSGSARARAGSERGSAKKSVRERLQEFWQICKFHKSDGKCGDGRNENIQGAAAIALDGARKLKNTPKKAAAFFRNLGSEFSAGLSKFANSISSIELPKIPERQAETQQPRSFTRITANRSWSQRYSSAINWCKEKYSNLKETMSQPTQPYTYSPPNNVRTPSFSSRALKWFEGIKSKIHDYNESVAYTRSRSSFQPTGKIPTPTMPKVEVKEVASKFAKNASWVCKIAGDGARDAVGYACSSAASRAATLASGAKTVSNYTTSAVHATWLPRR